MVIGITGGMATGKSTVAQMFAEFGAELVSADHIAREIVLPGSPVLERIVQRFGADILMPDGSLDRAKLGEIVFSDPKARADLEAITHPEIIAILSDRIRHFRDSPRGRTGVLVAEIPLLFEVGLRALVDRVVVVAAEQPTQANRLINRNGVSRQRALARLKTQMPIERKIAEADWVVRNDGDLSETRRQVEQIWAQATAGGRAER